MLIDSLAAEDRRLMTLLCTGMTDGEVADRLGFAAEEVEGRVQALLDRLGLPDRAELLAVFALGG